jgi:amino acid transporter, AAT family
VLGALLMAGILVGTAFTREFRMTLAYGLAFLVVLVVVYALWYRHRAMPAAAARPDAST